MIHLLKHELALARGDRGIVKHVSKGLEVDHSALTSVRGRYGGKLGKQLAETAADDALVLFGDGGLCDVPCDETHVQDKPDQNERCQLGGHRGRRPLSFGARCANLVWLDTSKIVSVFAGRAQRAALLVAFEAFAIRGVAPRTSQGVRAAVERLRREVGTRRILSPKSGRHGRRAQSVRVAHALRIWTFLAFRSRRQKISGHARTPRAVFAPIGVANVLSDPTPCADCIQRDVGGRVRNFSVVSLHSMAHKTGECDRVFGQKDRVVVHGNSDRLKLVRVFRSKGECAG